MEEVLNKEEAGQRKVRPLRFKSYTQLEDSTSSHRSIHSEGFPLRSLAAHCVLLMVKTKLTGLRSPCQILIMHRALSKRSLLHMTRYPKHGTAVSRTRYLGRCGNHQQGNRWTDIHAIAGIILSATDCIQFIHETAGPVAVLRSGVRLR